MSTMRAITLSAAGGPEVLELADVALPTRAGAELLIRVGAAGVNPIDAKTRSGKGVFGAAAAFPLIIGSDFSGVVVEAPIRVPSAPARHRGVRHAAGSAQQRGIRAVRHACPR